jgi:replicative DNA helicase
LTVPHNAAAEAAALGAVLCDPSRLQELDGLSPEEFWLPKHRAMYAAMLRLAERGESLDILALQRQLEAADSLRLVGGLAGINEIADHGVGMLSTSDAAAVIAEAAKRRTIRQVAISIAEEAGKEPDDPQAWVDGIEARILDVTRRGGGRGWRTMAELVRPAFESMIEQARRKDPLVGVPSGLADLDAMTGGFRDGQLIVVAGRPSMGKTALALNIVERAAEHASKPAKALVFSLEMADRELVERLLAGKARVGSDELRSGRLTEMTMTALVNAAGRAHKLPICINDQTGITISDIRATARRWRTDRDVFPKGDEPAVVVVDYIGLVSGSKDHRVREQEIAEISRGLKAMAKELKLPVLCLAQLNRGVEARSDKRPLLSDLRESGAIEQDADVVMFVHRPERYVADPEARKKVEGLAEVIVAKQRNGACGIVQCAFIGKLTRFESIERRE